MEPAILSRLKDDILAFASQQVYNKELLYIIILRINIMAQQNDQECLVQLDRHVRLLTPGGDYDPLLEDVSFLIRRNILKLLPPRNK